MEKAYFTVTKSNTPPWVLFTFFKFYQWYQTAQRDPYKDIETTSVSSSRCDTFIINLEQIANFKFVCFFPLVEYIVCFKRSRF